jgi:hypothetical protein
MLILYAMPPSYRQRKWLEPPLDGSDWFKTKELRVFCAVPQKVPIVVNGKKFNSMMPAMGL